MSFPLFLAQKGLFREDDIPELTKEAEKALGGIDEVLSRGGMSGDDILTLKSEYYGMPARTLDGTKIPVDVLKYIPEDSARHYQVAPLSVENQILEIGIVDPDMTQARDAVQFIAAKLGMPLNSSSLRRPTSIRSLYSIKIFRVRWEKRFPSWAPENIRSLPRPRHRVMFQRSTNMHALM